MRQREKNEKERKEWERELNHKKGMKKREKNE